MSVQAGRGRPSGRSAYGTRNQTWHRRCDPPARFVAELTERCAAVLDVVFVVSFIPSDSARGRTVRGRAVRGLLPAATLSAAVLSAEKRK